MATIETLQGEITLDLKNFEKSINKADSLNNKLKGGISKTTKFVSTALVGAFAAASAAAGAFFANSINAANDANTSISKFESGIGATRENAEKLSKVAIDVWANNYGDSIGDVTDKMNILIRSFEANGFDALDTNLQSLTQNAISLSDAFGADITRSTSAASTLMENFGLTGEEAFDFIAAGFDRGLDSSGDFLDSINEYSTQFQSGGSTADEFFSLLDSGFQSGMLGTDKAADAFKEFRVRLLDGSKASEEALEMLGLSLTDIEDKIASGESTYVDVFNTVQDKILETEDPALRLQAGVGLIGTQFEDMGEKAFAEIDFTQTKMSELAGSADQVQRQYETTGDVVSGIWRTGTKALLPFSTKIIEFANKHLPKLQDWVNRNEGSIIEFTEAIEDFLVGAFDKAQDVIDDTRQALEDIENFYDRNKTAIETLGIALGTFATIIGATIGIIYAIQGAMIAYSAITTAATVVTTAFGAAMAFVTSPLVLVALAIAALVAVGFLLYKNWNTIVAKVKELWGKFASWFGDMMQKVKNFIWDNLVVILSVALGPLGTAIGLIIKNWDSIWSKTKEVFGNVSSFIGDKINGIKGFFDSLVTKSKEVIDTLKNFFSNAGDLGGSITSAIKSFLNANVIDKFNGMQIEVLGKAIGLPDLPRLQTGGIIPGNSFGGDQVVARLNSGEEVVTRNDRKTLGEMIRTMSMNGSGGSKNVTVNNYFEEGMPISAISKQIERQIKLNL